MFLSKVDSIYDIRWNEAWTYGELRAADEPRCPRYAFEVADTARTSLLLDEYEKEAKACLAAGLVRPAYEATLQCSHLFNVLDARGAVSATDRVGWIRRVRDLACACARLHLEAREGAGQPAEPVPAAV